jgi:outer membrane protein OmpA-like peptidoglycan-associated protein
MMNDFLTRFAALLSVIVYAMFLSSCTNTPVFTEGESILHKTRIVERDLLSSNARGTPYYGSIDRSLARRDLVDTANKNTGERSNLIEKYFIPFGNESSRLDASLAASALNAIKTNINESNLVVIVGNSHGPSHIGTGILAQQRSDAVYWYFVKNGVDSKRIRRIASWDNTNVQHAPSRGVQVLIVNNEDPAEIYLTLAKY